MVLTPATIRIDNPGDGAWIMQRVSGFFTPECDHVFMRHRGEQRLGGFVLCGYLGASMTVHMAGVAPGWCSRTLMWLVFDYAFNQLGLRKLIAPVDSANTIAIEMDLRAGWHFETVVREVYPDGDLVVLSMTRAQCPWLRIKPDGWVAGSGMKEAA